MNSKIQTVTRREAKKMIGKSSALWAARCRAYGEPHDHILAWGWIRNEEGAPEEGVEIEPGTVRLTSPDGTRYRVVA